MENTPTFKKLTLNESALSNLEIVRKWSLFFSILGFIWMGFMLLLSVSLSFIPFGHYGGHALGFGRIGMSFFIIMWLAMIVLYFFPILYLYKFSVYSKAAIKNLDSESADNAFRYLKKHFQFVGVLTIIVLSIYLLLGFFGVFAKLMMF